MPSQERGREVKDKWSGGKKVDGQELGEDKRASGPGNSEHKCVSDARSNHLQT